MITLQLTLEELEFITESVGLSALVVTDEDDTDLVNVLLPKLEALVKAQCADTAHQVRELYAGGYSQVKLAEMFNVPRLTIAKMLSDK